VVRVSEVRTPDRLQISCEYKSLELRPKTSKTGQQCVQMREDCSRRWGRSMRTDEQQCLSMKTVLMIWSTCSPADKFIPSVVVQRIEAGCWQCPGRLDTAAATSTQTISDQQQVTATQQHSTPCLKKSSTSYFAEHFRAGLTDRKNFNGYRVRDNMRTQVCKQCFNFQRAEVLPPGEWTCIKLAIVRAVHKNCTLFWRSLIIFFASLLFDY